MDYFNRCLFCLEAIPDDASECPHCGKKGIPKINYTDALVPGTILAGRYLIGDAIERSSYLIRYKALDCVDDEKVFVDEFFPQSMAHRKPGKLTLEIDESSMMLAERAKKAWLSSDAKAAFQENMTVYVVFSEVMERTPDEERTVMQTEAPLPKPDVKKSPTNALGIVLLCIGFVLIALGAKIFFDPPMFPDPKVQPADAPKFQKSAAAEPVSNEISDVKNGDKAPEVIPEISPADVPEAAPTTVPEAAPTAVPEAAPTAVSDSNQ